MCFETTDYKSQQGHPDTTIKERSNQVLDKLFDNLITTGTCISRISVEEMMKDNTEQPNEVVDPTQFIKLDTGKRRLSLLEPQFILSVGDVITFGATKYAANNWRLCEDTSRYKDALLRHIYAYLSGERYDQETGIEHIAHASCNLMFLQYFDNLNKDQQ